MRRIVLAVLLVLAGVVVPAGSARAASSAPSDDPGTAVVAPAYPLGHAGRWITAADGRVFLPHGVNLPTKTDPPTPTELGFGADDAAWLAQNGFSEVRLTVERYRVEPEPGKFDDAYLQAFADTVRTLAAQGITSLIDFHVDEYGPVFYDNGYPDWMTVTDGLPNTYQVGFPAQYTANAALNRAYDHLWQNDPDSRGVPLQTDDAGILAATATALRDLPSVAGYEILNEPWPGTQYPACFDLAVGCPTFDQGLVSAYYQRMTTALRAADPVHPIWYEPLVTFNYGVPSSVVPPADPQLGFAFHVYPACSAADDAGLPVSPGTDCEVEAQRSIQNALDYGTAHGLPLLETEFGASFNTDTLAQSVSDYDAAMIPWLFWAYTRYVDVFDSSSRLTPMPGGVNGPIVDVLVRPSPELVAGTPTSYSYDPSSHTFRLAYATTRAGTSSSFAAGSETDVVVPARAYPGGYGVQVVGGRVASAAGAGVLRIASCGGASSVTVTVAPGASSSSCDAPGTDLPDATVAVVLPLVGVAVLGMVFRRRRRG